NLCLSRKIWLENGRKTPENFISRHALFHAVLPLSSLFRKSLQQSDTDLRRGLVDTGTFFL
ncbi:MAG: hypothetical protein IJR72_01645, partial [Oscillospiraceae bacterium]|nr:hypothetical protein [Oscillospiraceae bacterium]